MGAFFLGFFFAISLYIPFIMMISRKKKKVIIKERLDKGDLGNTKFVGFSMYERSNLAKEKKIDNRINSQKNANNIKKRLKDLHSNITVPLWHKYGKENVLVTSGFRCLELNRLLKSKDYSQHCRGEAMDFIIKNADLYQVYRWIFDTLEFDQLIFEGPKGRQWLHCSFVKNRKSHFELPNPDRLPDKPKGGE